MLTIALTGDVMMGRLVDQCVIRDHRLPPETLWGDALPLLLKADLRLINLECVISSRGTEWRPSAKAFHFRAHPRAIEVLKAAHIDCVTLANNHILDYGEQALTECLALLDRVGIAHAGADLDLKSALLPAILDIPGGRIAVVAITDNEPAWAATERAPGVNHIEYDDQGLVEPYRSRIAHVLKHARQAADFLVVSAHIGPNWGAPSPAMRMLAHELLDLGADVYWGHSNHTPQGIEVYKSKAILYSTGDFVDDYAVDPDERNDLTFLFLIQTEQNRIRRIGLWPVAIADFRARRGKDDEIQFLTDRIRKLSAEFGTAIEWDDARGELTVNVA